MSKINIYTFGAEDRSTDGNAIGAIINDRLAIPILKAFHQLAFEEPFSKFLTNTQIENWLEPKLELNDSDLLPHKSELEWQYRLRWALDKLKNNKLIEKILNTKESWKITKKGQEFIYEYGLDKSDELEPSLLIEIRKKLSTNNFENTKVDLDGLLQEFSLVAVDWFQKQNWLEENFSFFNHFFLRENIESATWETFQEMGNHLHSFNSLAIAKGNALGKPNLTIEEYKRIFLYLSEKSDPINISINNLFKKYQGKFYLPFFGNSTISELIAYLYSDSMVIYNSRSLAAINYLGITLQNKRGEKFGEFFQRYNTSIEDILVKYEAIVGKQTSTTIPLELDQFFSWLYENKVQKNISFKEIVELVKINLKDDDRFSFEKTAKNFVWIHDQNDIIGNKELHYELYHRGEFIHVDLHFEDNLRTLFYNKIGDSLPTYFKWINWQNGKSVRCINSPRTTDFNVVDILCEQIILLEEELGDKLRTIFSGKKPGHNDFNKNNISLNQILYGPPGTGKTFSTIDRVVELCHSDYKKENHEHNKKLFDNLVSDGRVLFTTFHQSMSYEDFIEGIKPQKPGEQDAFIKYDVEPGIFKQISNSAKAIKSTLNGSIDWEKANYYKMSIGGKNRPDIHNWCINNNVVGLSWGGEEALSKVDKYALSGNWIEFRDQFKKHFPITANQNRYNIQAAFIFCKMQIGDIVIISKGNHIIDAIGSVTGEYFYDVQTPTDMINFRKIEWLAKDLEMSPEKFVQKQISQQSIYEFSIEDIKKETFTTLFKIENQEVPYVLVIDEINRGNVSSIFGELITLIEDDKRIGKPNELRITLPYSKEKFGVPPNLHIIGTMNTADRSVEALDTALRRRFSFVEMLPNPKLLMDRGEDKNGNVGSINLPELLSVINARIEVLVDRDHTIGHAFFMDVKSIVDLKHVFADKIIPLLQEYFYGNYAKMEMVLGPNFFDEKNGKKPIEFAVQNNNIEVSETNYKLKNIRDDRSFDLEKALKRLLNTSDSEVEKAN